MTEVLTPSVAELVGNAANVAAEVLPAGASLSAGEPSHDFDHGDLFGQAICVDFSGSLSGELLIVVDHDLAGALTESDVDPAQALTPAVTAAAEALGPVVLGAVHADDTSEALGRLREEGGEFSIVPLWQDDQIKAAVGLRITGGAETEGFTALPGSGGAKLSPVRSLPEVSPQRLDLLRAVEMDVTAEIGRTKMTVSELLSLRDGFVVELDRPAGAPADLLVNGRLIARGEVVVIDENFGLRITEIVTDTEGN